MQAKVQKWGNSLAIRIPKVFVRDAQLKNNSLVEISFVDGRIIITPAFESKWTLDELLAGININNIPHNINTGLVKGNEAW